MTRIILSLALFPQVIPWFFCFSCLVWNYHLESVSNLFSQVSKTQFHKLNCTHRLGASDLSSSFSERVVTIGGKENQFADIMRLSHVTLTSHPFILPHAMKEMI